MAFCVPDESASCEESEDEDVDEATARELTHLLEEQDLHSTRRRIIRDANGQQITSYAQLNGHRQGTSWRTRRTHLLQLESDNIASAQKNSILLALSSDIYSQTTKTVNTRNISRMLSCCKKKANQVREN